MSTAWPPLPPPASPNMAMRGPRVPDAGTWSSPGYRSADSRTQAGTVFHGLAALASLAGAIVVAQVFGLLDLDDRFQLTQAEWDAWVAQLEGTDSLEGLASLLAIISLMAWLSRSVDNTPPLGGGVARRGPRWAIGAWFIPIVNIVMPALILRDLARRLSPDGTGRDRLVLVWWLAYWGPTVISLYVLFFLPITGTDSLREWYTGVLALQLLSVVGYVVTIYVMRRLQQDAEYWEASISAGTPPTPPQPAPAQAGGYPPAPPYPAASPPPPPSAPPQGGAPYPPWGGQDRG